jgi:hypothetical protein
MSRLSALSGNAVAFARYLTGLRAFLRDGVDEARARSTVEARMASRGAHLLDMLDRAVYRQPGSPYLALLRHAGAELGDAAKLIEEEGVEGALGRLYEAGVYVTVEEFKGLRPIERPGSRSRSPPPTSTTPSSPGTSDRAAVAPAGRQERCRGTWASL